MRKNKAGMFIVVTALVCTIAIGGALYIEAGKNEQVMGDVGHPPEVKAEVPLPKPKIDKCDWKLILINENNKIDPKKVPALDSLNSVHKVDARVLPDLEKMLKGAKNAGHSVMVCSSFRTGAKQQTLYENKVAQMKKTGLNQDQAEEKAATIVARPGTSEHEMGIAVDITATAYTTLNSKQAERKEQKWLMEHCWEYGFILRYPKGKTEITGVVYEPWHYRYVGIEAAKEITQGGLTLEEYLEQ